MELHRNIQIGFLPGEQETQRTYKRESYILMADPEEEQKNEVISTVFPKTRIRYSWLVEHKEDLISRLPFMYLLCCPLVSQVWSEGTESFRLIINDVKWD